jgi:hypothetical protein
MPIRYVIQPDLDLLLYVFEGECTSKEYFEMYHFAYLDGRRHHGMKVLVDLSRATLDFDTQGLREATMLMAENKAAEFPPDHLAMLTKGTSLRFLKETLELLADGIPIHLEIFHNVHDAIRWLGLAGMENETMRFWEANS